MQQSTLQEILGVEKEIHEMLDAEHAKANRWLEDERRRIETTHAAEMERLRAVSGQDDETVKQAAANKAAEIIRQAEQAVSTVQRIRDDDLRPRVARHIACIVPGTPRAR
jgi:NAD(P)H-hydrate repair Nnr-like enzyme with NAD(P)H-hydrate dehydratase domain